MCLCVVVLDVDVVVVVVVLVVVAVVCRCCCCSDGRLLLHTRSLILTLARKGPQTLSASTVLAQDHFYSDSLSLHVTFKTLV